MFLLSYIGDKDEKGRCQKVKQAKLEQKFSKLKRSDCVEKFCSVLDFVASESRRFLSVEAWGLGQSPMGLGNAQGKGI